MAGSDEALARRGAEAEVAEILALRQDLSGQLVHLEARLRAPHDG